MKYKIILLSVLIFGPVSCDSGSDGGAAVDDNDQDSRSSLMPIPQTVVGAYANPVLVTGRYRGFNLQGMYKEEWGQDQGFKESDFQIISELGFNYVRLPLDYKTYTTRGDWYDYLEQELRKIDMAIEYGQKYGVHVSLNLHQAPGYCVHEDEILDTPDNQKLDLWTNEAAQLAFVTHWRLFAHRYQNIPNEYLTFNLVNEPRGHVTETNYLSVMNKAIDAIRAISPDRQIVLDGTNVANSTLKNLTRNNIVQSLHAYDPFYITHYGAPWVPGSETWPIPKWPPILLSNFLYGSWKQSEGLTSTLIINGDFAAGTEVTINVRQVSTQATLIVKSDETEIIDQYFEPGPGLGDWTEVIYDETWGIYQNIYNRSYVGVVPADSAKLTFAVTEGDWLNFNYITVQADPGDETTEITLEPDILEWGVPQAEFNLTAAGELVLLVAPAGFAEQYRIHGYFDEWLEYRSGGNEVIVGEFGVYSAVPHSVTLAFLEDRLKIFKDSDIGWALWDLNGSIGIFDSNRADVVYEPYRGYQLDRAMLELLQRY